MAAFRMAAAVALAAAFAGCDNGGGDETPEDTDSGERTWTDVSVEPSSSDNPFEATLTLTFNKAFDRKNPSVRFKGYDAPFRCGDAVHAGGGVYKVPLYGFWPAGLTVEIDKVSVSSAYTMSESEGLQKRFKVPVTAVTAGLYRGETVKEAVKVTTTDNVLSTLITAINNTASTNSNGDACLIVIGADDGNVTATALTRGIKLLTVCGDATPRTLTVSSSGGSLLKAAGNNTSLTLGRNLTLTGINSNTKPLVDNFSYVTMEEGSRITGNTNTDTYNNYGGGVYGSVTMHGGKIYGNTATSSGGGAYGGGVSGGVTMYGGEIYGNKATSSSGDAEGGGVYGGVTMYGGAIYNNTATATGSGTYKDAYGGGVSGDVTMHGGEIYGNKAESSGGAAYGGGVYCAQYYGFSFTKTGGVIYGKDDGGNANTVSSTTGSQGAAVYLEAYYYNQSYGTTTVAKYRNDAVRDALSAEWNSESEQFETTGTWETATATVTGDTD